MLKKSFAASSSSEVNDGRAENWCKFNKIILTSISIEHFFDPPKDLESYTKKNDPKVPIDFNRAVNRQPGFRPEC